jgi:hypothetical protein
MDKMNPLHLDAGETAFFERQLEHVKSRTYDTKFKNLKATTLLPVSTEAHAGAETITWKRFTQVGFAKVVSDYAKDFPRVDVYGEEVTSKIKSLGDSYGYSIQEVRRAQKAGTNLDQRRATAARRAIEELTDKLAWFGDTETGIQGFINYPGITEFTVPNDGTGSSKTWATKTGDQIVRDVTGLVNAVWATTNGREVPDTLLLPMEQYNLIATKRMEGNSDMTVLKYLKENLAYLTKIDWLPELDTAGAAGTDRMIVYVRDLEHVSLELPQPFEQFPAQQKGMEFEIFCHARHGGVIVYYPLSVAYGDGI